MRAFVIGVALAMAGAAAYAGGDIEAGRQKAAPCAACHGADGQGTSPQYPRLAGQHPDYLVHALRAYQSGARQNPVMAPFAAPLSAQDMEDLAAYFAALPNGLGDTRIAR